MAEQPWDEPLLGEYLAQCRILYAMPYEMTTFHRLAQIARRQGAHVVIDVETAMVSDVDRLNSLLSLADALRRR